MSVRLLISAAGQPVAQSVTGMTSGRLGAIVAALLGLLGVAIGGFVLARARRVGAGFGRRGPLVAMAAGLTAMALGGLVVATADGGPGTGNGMLGGYVSLLVGLISLALGGLARARTRRVAAR